MPIKLKHKGAWHEIASLNTTGTTKIATLYDAKTQDTGGGSPSGGAWNNRILNTKVDPQSFVTFGGGSTGTNGTNTSFSLAAGTYHFEWRAPAWDAGLMRARLAYNVNSDFSGTTNYILGESAQSDTYSEANTFAFGSGTLTTAVTTYFRIEHYVAGGTLGLQSNIAEEIYTQVIIQDLATAVLKSTSTGTTKVAKVEDVKAYDEGGGEASPASKWVVRNLNTISDQHSVGITSTNLGRMSIPAGTYRFNWRAPAYAVKRHTCRLVYSTDSTLGVGNSTALYASGNYEQHEGVDHDQGWSMGVIPSVTFSSTTYFQIEHQIQNTMTQNENGFGVNSNISGVDSIYTTIEIEDLSSAVLKSTSTGTTKVAKLYQTETKGTGGGTYANPSELGTWKNRTLNAKTDPNSLVVLDSGNVYFSVPAGSYEIKWDTPAYMLGSFQSRLQYDDNSSFSSPTSVLGSTEFASTNDGVQNAQLSSTGIAVFTVSENTYVRIQIQGSGTPGDANALGKPSDIDTEIYTQVSVEDLATAVKTSTGDGKVINVWNVTYDGTQLIDSESWTDISDLTVTLTPQSASSKFLITAVVNSGMDADGYDGLFRLLRGSTVIGSVNENQTNGWTGFGQIAGQQGFTGIQSMVITYLDTPNTTSPLTYHIEGINTLDTKNVTINYRGAGTFTTTSHMTITELRP